VTATKSSDSVFPVSQDERQSLASLKENADAAYKAGNLTLAQSLASEYSALKLELNEKNMTFSLVDGCLKNALACEAMELRVMQYEKAGYDYYQHLYNRVGGELYNLKQAYLGASVFDPLKLKEMSVDTASLLVNNLALFQFPEFTTAFLDEMK